MDRASGWYKKHTQIVLFFVGLAISIVFNVDTLKIVDKLEKDPKLRQQIVQQADAFVQDHPNLDTDLMQQEIEYKKAVMRSMQIDSSLKKSDKGTVLEDSLKLVKYRLLKERKDTLLNRSEKIIKNDIKNVNHSLGLGWEAYDSSSFLNIFYSLIGWMVTALALSLGAPFWFDLLNRLMKLRGSVATPTSDDREKKQG